MLAWREILKASAPYYRNYIRALKTPEAVQAGILKDILKGNRDTQLGRRYEFDSINSVREYQRRLPVRCYPDFEPYISLMKEGSHKVLCEEPVLLFEKTSGTHAQPKFIPYTQRSLAAFRAALFPWLYDLCRNYPQMLQGSAYWSISPVGRDPYTCTQAGIPIGMANDALYFGETVARHIEATLAVPAWVARLPTLDSWRYITLRYLVGDADLSLISVWSPTFLLQLMDSLHEHLDRLVGDLESGRITCPEAESFIRNERIIPNPQRAKTVAECVTGTSIDTGKLWPRLTLISCWASAGSAQYAARLRKLFPAAALQGKGLLATEGVVSIPQVGVQACPLALLSGFYEFLNDRGEACLTSELESGATYSVALTNYSGLYRYSIGDRVKVIDWLHNTPCLEFVGRGGGSTDLCGEKLTEEFILPHLQGIPGFSLLVPNPDPKPHYCLYVDSAAVPVSQLARLSREFEAALQQNPQYAYARYLRQLDPVRLVRTVKPMASYQNRFLSQAAKLGDIKPPCLSRDVAWHGCFSICEC